MSEKDYRKLKPLKGTIFDKSRTDDPVARQRRMGFLYDHGVNPAAVAKNGVHIESIGDGKVRVHYFAIYIPEDQEEWPDGRATPAGVWCEHGGYKKRHTVKQIRSFVASLSEVLA